MNKNNVLKYVYCMLIATLLSSCVFIVNNKNKEIVLQRWFGIYHGILPCASCSGIDTWIQLSGKDDETYFKKVENYLEEEDGIFTSYGKVEIEEDKNVLILHGKNEKTRFLLGKNELSLLSNSEKESHNIDSAYTLYKMPNFNSIE